MERAEQKKLMELGKRSIDLMEPYVKQSMITEERLESAIIECKNQPKKKRALCKKLLKIVSKRKGRVNYTTNEGLAAFHSFSSQMNFAPSCTKIWPLHLE